MKDLDLTDLCPGQNYNSVPVKTHATKSHDIYIRSEQDNVLKWVGAKYLWNDKTTDIVLNEKTNQRPLIEIPYKSNDHDRPLPINEQNTTKDHS